MTTPVLSKKQQRKALSGKKAPAKGLRNVLSQPYKFSWPILKNENIDDLKILLETSMPAIKRPIPNIPWSRLHRMNKKERQVARDEARSKLDVPLPDENILNSIVMGVNEVTRLLEKDNASCIILEADVDPKLLIKHIVSMANLKNVPVILVPFLKNVMLETVGFASAALALKKTVARAEDHHFHNLYKEVVELAAEFETRGPLKLDFKADTGRGSTLEESITPEESSDEQESETNKIFTLSTDVYKYRNSRKERVFVPGSAIGSETSVAQKLDTDFISIGKDLDLQVSGPGKMKNKRKTRYINIHAEDSKNSLEIENDSMQLDQRGNKHFKYESLKVKRLQGNSKRVKATKDPKGNRK